MKTEIDELVFAPSKKVVELELVSKRIERKSIEGEGTFEKISEKRRERASIEEP